MNNRKKLSDHKLSYQDYPHWSDICPENEYRVISSDELPRGTPDSLRKKTIQAVIMSSGDTANNCTVIVADFIRYDKPDHAVDQELLIMVFDHDERSATGSFIHHGGWSGRTVNLEPEIALAVEKSEIAMYLPVIGIPEKPEGPLADLKAHPQGHAFWNAVVITEYPQNMQKRQK